MSQRARAREREIEIERDRERENHEFLTHILHLKKKWFPIFFI